MVTEEIIGEDYREMIKLPRADVQDLGGNVCVRGVQNSGKTALMVKFVNRLIWQFDYTWDDTCGNIHMWVKKPVYRLDGKIKHGTVPAGAEVLREGIPIPGYTYMDNEHLRKYIRKVYRKSRGLMRRKIIMLDEIDQCYSHLESVIDNEARDDLLTLWQDKKLENYFIYTKHIGLGVNKIIRSATEVSIKPYFDRRFDTLYGMVIDGFTMSNKLLTFKHASDCFPHYDRWEYIF
jgi:hypothetical protein